MLQTLTFAGPRLINAAASFFRYESGSAGGADESIRLRADGQDLGTYYPGDSVELPQACSSWEISPTSSACAGIVRLGVGRVQSARLSGRVSVVDEITDALQCFAFLPGVAVKPFSSVVVLSPASNVRGAILRWAATNAQPTSTGVAYAAFLAAKTQPTDYTNPAQRYPILSAYSNAAAVLSDKSVALNKYLPPGWGIYAQSEVVGAVASNVGGQIGFEVL